MIAIRALALLPFLFGPACSEDSASSNVAASSRSAPAAAAPRIATWAGPPPGRLAVAHGRLAVANGCLTLQAEYQGELRSRDIALPQDAAAWDAGKRTLLVAGNAYSLGQTVAVAGGSIDRAKAASDPAFALNGCASGPIVFVVERVFDEWPPRRP